MGKGFGRDRSLQSEKVSRKSSRNRLVPSLRGQIREKATGSFAPETEGRPRPACAAFRFLPSVCHFTSWAPALGSTVPACFCRCRWESAHRPGCSGSSPSSRSRRESRSCSVAELLPQRVRLRSVGGLSMAAGRGYVVPEALSGRILQGRRAGNPCSPGCCGLSSRPEIGGEGHQPNWDRVAEVAVRRPRQSPLDAAFPSAAHRTASRHLSVTAKAVGSTHFLAEARNPGVEARPASWEAKAGRRRHRAACLGGRHPGSLTRERRPSSWRKIRVGRYTPDSSCYSLRTCLQGRFGNRYIES